MKKIFKNLLQYALISENSVHFYFNFQFGLEWEFWINFIHYKNFFGLCFKWDTLDFECYRWFDRWCRNITFRTLLGRDGGLVWRGLWNNILLNSCICWLDEIWKLKIGQNAWTIVRPRGRWTGRQSDTVNKSHDFFGEYSKIFVLVVSRYLCRYLHRAIPFFSVLQQIATASIILFS